MMMMRLAELRRGVLLALACQVLLVGACRADDRRQSDTPFKIEDFAPKNGRYTLSAGIGFSAADNKNVYVATTSVPILHGYSILLPEVTNTDVKKDTLFTRLGLRYRAGERLNLSLGLKADASRSLVRENTATSTEYDADVRSFTSGVDYRITNPVEHPFVLAFAEIALAEKSGDTILHGKTATVGLSSHWAFDPVILSLTGTYSYLAPREISGKRQDPGDLLGLGLSFGFSVNQEISFRWGLAQSFRDGDKVDGVKKDWTSGTSLSLGYTQRLTPSLVMNIDAQESVVGSDAAQMFANFTWRP